MRECVRARVCVCMCVYVRASLCGCTKLVRTSVHMKDAPVWPMA